MFETLLDALLDTLKLMPLLFVAHILIEVLEHAAVGRIKTEKALKGGLAPLIGSGVGLLPQCGFSVVAAKLYSGRHITMGTLLAVFVATSDEAVPILLASPSSAFKLLPLLAVKFLAALIIGYGASLVLSKKEKTRIVEMQAGESIAVSGCHGHTVMETEKHEHSVGEKHEAEIDEKKEKREKTLKMLDRYLWHPFLHTLTVSGYILIVNIALGLIIFYVTQERLEAFMQSSRLLQPLFAAVVGLVPNCASSVAIAELFASGALSLGGASAGLIVNAGLGLAVLFKENKNLKENIAVFVTLFVFAVIVGTAIELVLLAAGLA